MPLFMDFHKIDNVTIEDVKSAHVADEAIQDKYGVKYHQFWVNQEAGSVFCLVEGPDAATCELVHKMAHGNLPCALTQVESYLYETIMGKQHKIDHGHVSNTDGTVDVGYRNILVVTVYGITKATSSKDLSQLQRPFWARKIIAEKIVAFHGREVQWATDDSIIAVFNETNQLIKCALSIQNNLVNAIIKESEIIFRMGLSAAQPVTETGNFFTDAIKLAHKLSVTARDNQILVSSLVKKLCKEDGLLANTNLIKSLTSAEEEFLTTLLLAAEKKLIDQHFDLNKLSSEICISRPQLYRKITAVTGRSPNDFMRDLRLDKAVTLLKQKKANIAEIAYEIGFTSPSYFTKCFTEKFGYTPSAFAKTSSN